MDEKQYYQISEQKKLPLRCPILNYCSRRADTIYIFSDYNKRHPNEDGIDVLQREGVLLKDFREKQVHVQGEPTHMIKGNSNMYFSGACPEVNLFDGMNAMISKVACVEGDYDKYYKEPKTRVLKCQHYSECPEFNNYLFHTKNGGNRKKRKTIPAKIKVLLQKEIDSTCPFCSNDDVEHFQIHHIDENPENNLFKNLLLLCPTCHSKITKGDISRAIVEVTKLELPSRHKIECASISIDIEKCSWKSYDDQPNTFIDDENDKNPSPILVFSLINHSSKTILLKEIELEAIHLYSGLSGIPNFVDLSQPGFLKSIALFEMDLPAENSNSKLILKEEIEVQAGRAFKFEIQIHSRFNNDIVTSITGRKHLFFSFKFNNNNVLKIPTIFLNCKLGEEGVKLVYLD